MSFLTPDLTDSSCWIYSNLMSLELEFRDKARDLLHLRLPSYPLSHCVKLMGGSPHEFSSRCVCDSENELIGIVAFSIGDLGTVEIVAFVSLYDGKGIGRFLMERLVLEMQEKGRSAILTYVEPAAVPFFSKLGFSRQVPARSLYERVISKYVKANLMYRDLLTAGRPSRDIAVGDRLMVLVDGTMTPRQCLVQAIDGAGKIRIHFFFWNSKHDEWIFPHSPRIRWDVELPPEAPKRTDQMVTSEQVKEVWAQEWAKEKKLEQVHAACVWPRGIKKKGVVEVKVEDMWIKAIVVEKNDAFCYCELEHPAGQIWLQDFPRDSVRLVDSNKSVLETLMAKKNIVKKTSHQKMVTRIIKKKKIVNIPLILSPIAKTTDSTSNRLARKHNRDTSACTAAYSNTSPCSICSTSSGPVLACCHCQLAAHPACYFLKSPEAGWACDTCKESFMRGGGKRYNPTCVVCHQTRREANCVMAQTLDYKSVHVRCAVEKNLTWVPTERRFSTFRQPHI